MSSAVEIRFVVAGTSEVARAFQSVEQSILKTDRATRKAYEADEKMSARLAAYKERLAQKTALEQERMAQRSYRENARVTTEEVRGAEKGAAQKLKADEAWAKQRMAIQLRSADMAYKLAEQEVRAHERMLAEKQRASERFSRVMARTATSSVSGTLSTGAHLAGAAMALGGGFGIGDIVTSRMSAERSAALLVNTVTTGAKPPAGANVNNILAKAGAIAIKTGMSKDDVLKGALSYSRSARGGDFGGTMQNMEFFAQMAKVTGADIGDIAKGAGILQSQNAALGKDPKAMQQMLLTAYAQTKSGSVSMVEASKQVGTLGSTRGFYSGDQGRNQSVLLGLGQIAAAGGSSEEIGTYIKNISMEAMKHKKDLKKLGVKYDKNGLMESPEQMLEAVMSGTKGDPAQITKLFGARGLPLMSELGNTYRQAGGGKPGIEAMREQIHGVTQSTMSDGDLQAQFAQTMSTNADKFATAVEQVKDTIETALLPHLEAFADFLGKPDTQKNIADLISTFGSLASYMAENPFKGIGAIVLAKVTGDIAAAAIGEAIKKQIVASFATGGGGSVPVPGGGGGAAAAPGLLGFSPLAWGLAVAGGSAYSGFNRFNRGKEHGEGTAGAGLDAATGLASYLGGPLGVLGSLGGDYAGDWARGKMTAGQVTANPIARGEPGGPAKQLDEHTALLKKIVENTKGGSSGSMAAPDNPNRQYPLGKGARP